jgi:hypothetical protein
MGSIDVTPRGGEVRMQVPFDSLQNNRRSFDSLRSLRMTTLEEAPLEMTSLEEGPLRVAALEGGALRMANEVFAGTKARPFWGGCGGLSGINP